jgi:hypothetical protein
MLKLFENLKTENPHHVFNKALDTHSDQVFMLTPTNVNQIIQTHDAFQDKRDQHLTVSQIWQGEKWKAERPQMFTTAIVAAAMIPQTRQTTAYGEVYDRVSIQPSWLTGDLIIVKEETHIDNLQNKVLFLGKPVDVAEAKEYLVEALLDEHFVFHSDKTVDLFKDMERETATQFLNRDFENMFADEQVPLFHVEHGVTGDEYDPIETWKLVRIAPTPQSEAEQVAVMSLREKIGSSANVRMYAQTMNELEALKFASSRAKL